MLENKSSQEKKKSKLFFNVGCSGCAIGGVVLLGGGLAVAGLVAAFTIIKKINSARYDQKNEDAAAAAAAAADTLPGKIRDVTQGLGSVLQNPTTAVHQKSCYKNHSKPTAAVIESQMDSGELISARNMESGDKSVAIMDGEKEDPQQGILFSDDFNKESVEPCNEILNNEETSLQAPDIIIKNHSVENLQLIQNSETKKEDELAETQNLAIEDALPMQSEAAAEEEEEEDDDDYGGSEEHVMDKEGVIPEGEIAPKSNSTMQPVEKEEKESEEDENLPMQPVEEEEGDDEDDHDEKHGNDDSSEEDVTEKAEESSEEGTGSSSRESNVEAIWPTDMIEALSHELKVMNASNQNSVEKMAKIECDYLNSKRENGSKNENAPTLNKKTPQEFVMSKVESIHLPMRGVCVWLLLAIILLLLLLHIHRTSPLHDLSYENSVIGPRV